MKTLENIFIADAVSNCIPVWSTLTNGCQLLYKLIHKVDAAAAPVIAPKAKLSTDLKIYILSKSQLKNWLSAIAMIPILGNIVSFVMIAKTYCDFKKSKNVTPTEKTLKTLISAISYNENLAQNSEIFRLILENRYLDHEGVSKSPNLLEYASRRLDLVQFSQLLNFPFLTGDTWSSKSLIGALQNLPVYLITENDLKSQTDMKKSVLEYWSKHIQSHSWSVEEILHVVKDMPNNEDPDYITQLTTILPKCSQEDWRRLIDEGILFLLSKSKNLTPIRDKLDPKVPATL